MVHLMTARSVLGLLTVTALLCDAKSNHPISKHAICSDNYRRNTEDRCGTKYPMKILTAAPKAPAATQGQYSSLIKVNVLMLLFYGTLGAAMPFLPIYYRSIGISDNQIGLLGAITPAITFFVSPLWGALADTTGKHKLIMLLTFIGSIVARCFLTINEHSVPWLMSVVAISAILNAPVKPLMDSAILSMLSDKADYGRSRLFGQLGFGMGSYISGAFKSRNIKAIFFMQLLFALPTALMLAPGSFDAAKGKSSASSESSAGGDSSKTKSKNKSASQSDSKSKSNSKSIKTAAVVKREKGDKTEARNDIVDAVKHAISEPKVLVFFLLVFVVGVSSGIIENFAYVRLSEIETADHLKHNVLGKCRMVSSLAGGPMFWLSGAICKRLGVNGVLSLTLLTYSVRFGIYALMDDPWKALPAEALRGAMFAIFWAGSTYYVYNASPKALTATMLGILNGVYGGLGQSLGSLIGGYMSRRFGIAKMFLICSAAELVFLGLFLLYQLKLEVNSSQLKRQKQREDKEREGEVSKKAQAAGGLIKILTNGAVSLSAVAAAVVVAVNNKEKWASVLESLQKVSEKVSENEKVNGKGTGMGKEKQKKEADGGDGKRKCALKVGKPF